MAIENYWGKQTDDGRYHLAAYHCIDVGLTSRLLLQYNRDFLRRLAKKLFPNEKRPQIKKVLDIVTVLGTVHDVGKISFPFQFSRIPVLCKKIYHKNSFKKFPDAVKAIEINFYHGEKLIEFYLKENGMGLPFFQGFSDLVWIAGEHHGVTLPKNLLSSIDYVKNKNTIAFGLGGSKKKFLFDTHVFFEKARELDAKDRRDFVESSLSAWGEHCGLVLPTDPKKYPMPDDTIGGVIAVSDWVSSNERYYTPISKPMPLVDYINLRKEPTQKALRDAGLVIPKVKHFDFKYAISPAINIKKPNELQDKIERLPVVRPSLTIIESDTGSGKTEAALIRAAKIAKKHGGGITFCSHTISAANSNLSRLIDIAPNIFGKDVPITLSTSQLASCKEYQKFIDQEMTAVLGDKIKISDQWLYDRSRRRSGFAPMTACTVDYIMQGQLGIMHQGVRELSQAMSTIIIDEVHSYDPFMIEIIKGVLRFAKSLDASVILLSATLPSHVRAEFVSTYGHEAVYAIEKSRPARKYPLITVVEKDAKKIKSFSLDVARKKQLKINLSTGIGNLYPSEEILLDCLYRSAGGQKVVVMCNLVSDCQSIYDDLIKLAKKYKIKSKIIQSHSRYMTHDRAKNDAKIISWCANKIDRPKFGEGCVVVATQVIEQSMDLDFDFAVMQMTYMDLLIQRLGRLWRTVEEPERTKAMGNVAESIVIVPENPDEIESYGHHYFVYKNVMALYNTYNLLCSENGKTNIFPDVYRGWIGRTYQKTKLSESLQKKYLVYEAECLRDKREAFENMKFKSGDIWGNDDFNSLLTRHGMHTRRVHLVTKMGSSFCSLVSGKPIVHPDDAKEKMIKSGMHYRDISGKMKLIQDEYYKMLEECAISISSDWIEDLRRYRKIFADANVIFVSADKGFFEGIAYEYFYSDKFGLKRKRKK